MTIEQMKAWVDGATYEQLLGRWRFAPIGSPWFQGEMGDYYRAKMGEKKREVGQDGAVQASKSLGWKP